jgi:alkanesulfonate monooxygenase SsuD/methylene tetrahydromethanopterin reductase-like flavin-dependent oxidoreductase (luciferase family)
MLELVARYADSWNAAWYGHPAEADELRERLANLDEALDAAERPRHSIERTAGVFVAIAPGDDDRPDEAIRGSVDVIGAALAGYAALGISHLIVHVWPRTVEAIRLLGEAAQIARGAPPRRGEHALTSRGL